MKRALFLLLLVVIIPSINVITQTMPKPTQTVPRTNLGATVTNNSASSQFVTDAVSKYTQIYFNWEYSPNVPACEAILMNCYSGFTLTNTTTGEVIATPSTLGPTVLSYSYMPPGGVPYGVTAFSLVAIGYNGRGGRLTSDPATVSVVNNVTSLNSPINLLGRLQ